MGLHITCDNWCKKWKTVVEHECWKCEGKKYSLECYSSNFFF